MTIKYYKTNTYLYLKKIAHQFFIPKFAPDYYPILWADCTLS